MLQKLKYLLIALMTVMTVGTVKAQFRYGPLVGVSTTNLHFKQDIVPVKSTIGFQTGLQTEMMFPGIGFGIDFGLLYNLSGAKMNLGERLMWASQGYGNERLMIHEITIPFHLRFKYTRLNGFEDTLAPFISVGPDFHIQAGHSKCDAMKFSGGDVAFSFGLGAEIVRHWQISGQYTFGATYALKAKQLADYSSRTRQWTLRLAYLF